MITPLIFRCPPADFITQYQASSLERAFLAALESVEAA